MCPDSVASRICVCAPWVPVWVLVCLAKPAAEADGVEEAAVAQGLRVTAAKLGQTALCQLGAAAQWGVSSHVDSGRRKRALWRSRDLFGLLEGIRAERGCNAFTRTSKWTEATEKVFILILLIHLRAWGHALISRRKNKQLKQTVNSYKSSWIKLRSKKCWGVSLLTWQPCKHHVAEGFVVVEKSIHESERKVRPLRKVVNASLKQMKGKWKHHSNLG